MNGDEDLGQDIIMKGEKFHYAENPAKTNQTAAGRYQLAQEQNVQLEWDNPVQGPAEGVLFPQTGHAEHHTTYYAKKSPEVAFIETEGEPGTPVEGVHVIAPIPHQATFTGPSEFAYPNQRTTFYAQTGAVQFDQQNGLWRTFVQTSDDEKKPAKDAGTEPEKVHVLEPIAHQHRANTNQPGPRTTFYGQQ